MPRVTIDATALLLRSAGVKTYTYELIRALRLEHSAAEVRMFPFLDLPPHYDHEHSPLPYFPTMLRIAALTSGISETIRHGTCWDVARMFSLL